MYIFVRYYAMNRGYLSNFYAYVPCAALYKYIITVCSIIVWRIGSFSEFERRIGKIGTYHGCQRGCIVQVEPCMYMYLQGGLRIDP